MSLPTRVPNIRANPAAPGISLLRVQGLSKHFGALRAVEQVSFDVYEGQVFAIIGPNGAGKTTAFNCITGYYPTTAGDVIFQDHKLTGLPEHRIAELGISRTFQKIRLFKNLNVLENVLLGTHCRNCSGVFDAFLRTPRYWREAKQAREKALELLHFVGLDKYSGSLARELSYGDQRRLEIARALATNPALVLLDEPVAGMNPQEKEEMMALIDTIRNGGVTVLLVEHDMNVVMGISDRIVVLDHGEKIAEGTPKEIQCDDRVIEAYLGRGFRREPTAS